MGEKTAARLFAVEVDAVILRCEQCAAKLLTPGVSGAIYHPGEVLARSSLHVWLGVAIGSSALR